MSSKTLLSALMVYINMHTTLLIAVAAVSIQAWDINDCEEFCKTSSIGTNYGIWQSYCDCSPGNPSFPHDQNILPVFDGIYYEPAEIYPVKEIYFTDPPFYLLTPGVRLNLENHSLADAGKLVRRRFNIPSRKDDHMRIKNSITDLDKMNVDNNKKLPENKEHPLYIDVTGEVSINKGRADHKEVDSFRKAQIMEKKLLECLDLHLLACSRQNAKINDLKEAWDSNKFEKYGKLTDNDLKNKIVEKCSEPAKVLKESLKQIKGKNSRQSSSFDDSKEKNTNNKENRTLYQPTLYKDKTLQLTEITTENSEIMHSFVPQQNKSDLINNRLNSKGTFFLKSNKTVSSTERTILNKDVNFDNNHKTMQPLDEETFNKIIYTQTTIDTAINSETELEFTFADNLYNNNHLKSTHFIPDPTPIIEHKPIIGDQKIKTNSYADNVFATETFENSITPNDGFPIENNKAEYKKKELELRDEINSDYNLVEASTNKIQNFEIITEKHKIEGKTELMLPTGNDNILLNSDGTATTKIVSHPEDRNIIMEDQLQIPKIVTIEFPNDTAVSNINGIEQIPNNDFVNDEMHMIRSDQDNKSRQIIFNESKFGSPEAKNITVTTSKITGKLVFIFDKQNIPAHFVQSTDGNIHVGVDGPALCEKLEFVGNKSVLLTVICNCFRYNNCTKH